MKEKIADIVRKYGNTLPVPIISVANDQGIDVYETDEFKDDESGSIQKEGEKFVIYVNSKHSPARKRFTIAHEIGHFLLHSDKLETKEHIDQVRRPVLMRSKTSKANKEELNMERDADEAAASILMPEAEFKKIWTESKTVAEIAEIFNVSESAATVRAGKLLNQIIL